MAAVVRIDDDIKQRIKIRSSELGITQYDLLNRYLLKCLENDNEEVKKAPTVEEIKARLKYDKPEGNGFGKYQGIVDLDETTDAVELKRNSLKVD